MKKISIGLKPDYYETVKNEELRDFVKTVVVDDIEKNRDYIINNKEVLSRATGDRRINVYLQDETYEYLKSKYRRMTTIALLGLYVKHLKRRKNE